MTDLSKRDVIRWYVVTLLSDNLQGHLDKSQIPKLIRYDHTAQYSFKISSTKLKNAFLRRILPKLKFHERIINYFLTRLFDFILRRCGNRLGMWTRRESTVTHCGNLLSLHWTVICSDQEIVYNKHLSISKSAQLMKVTWWVNRRSVCGTGVAERRADADRLVEIIMHLRCWIQDGLYQWRS